MKLEWSLDPITLDIHFVGNISRQKMEKLRLDILETKLLQEPQTAASDFLLVAEMLFRRSEEQAPEKERPDA